MQRRGIIVLAVAGVIAGGSWFAAGTITRATAGGGRTADPGGAANRAR